MTAPSMRAHLPSFRSSNSTLGSGCQCFWRGLAQTGAGPRSTYSISSQGQEPIPGGEPGSPLRVLRQLASVRHLPGWATTEVYAHFYDSSSDKIRRLKDRIAGRVPEIPGLTLDIDAIEFQKALKRNSTVLKNKRAAKLILIDQCGVDHVTPAVFQTLVESPTCDFLFFLSSSTFNRFRDHPAIKQKIRID